MDTPDTAHQLDAEVVVAEVAHTMTNTQPSCSGGGKSNRILNTFKEVMDLPQAARLKEALNKDIANLENHAVFGLVQIASVPAGHKAVSIRWVLRLRRTVPTGVDSSCKGFWQIPGVDYGGSFVPDCRLQRICMMLAIEVELDYEVHILYLQMENPQRRCRRGRVRQDGTRLRNQRRSRSSSRHKAQEELVRSPAEPEELVRPYACGGRRHRLPSAQVGSVYHVHLRGREWLCRRDALSGLFSAPQR